MRIALCLVTLVACKFPDRTGGLTCETNDDCESPRVCDRNYCVLLDETPPADAREDEVDQDPIDATPPLGCADWYTPVHFDPCTLPMPSGPLVLSIAGTYVYNTTDATLRDPNGTVLPPPAERKQSTTAGNIRRIVSVDSFTINAGATLRVIGERALILASWSTIDIAGTIDVSSSFGGGAGAGANPMGVSTTGAMTGCVTHAAASAPANQGGGGGGGGGGYHGVGGRGADANTDSNVGAGGTGGGAIAIVATNLLGGCPGGAGGAGNHPGGVGGNGGGAVQLTARQAILVSGKINAGGSGGAGGVGAPDSDPAGQGNGGGGGGGSGGTIGLEAPMITVNGVLAANGGGGGGGADNGTGGPGAAGGLLTTAAAGGQGGDGVNGQGGAGSSSTSLVGAAGTGDPNDGGGGGGGAAGYIVLRGQNRNVAGGTFSPPAQLP
ncbi:MAG: hypothetical protein AB7O24_00695 [Kofleriaceae bacterium]